MIDPEKYPAPLVRRDCGVELPNHRAGARAERPDAAHAWRCSIIAPN